MSCAYSRVQRLALDPLEQLRREIELYPIDDADERRVRPPSSREESDIFEFVWVEDIKTVDEEE